MKKFLVIASMLALFTVVIQPVQAQVSYLKSQYNFTVDTITNTGTKYLTSPALSGYSKTLSVYFIAAEISGTSTITATLEVSPDGTSWSSYYASKDSTYTFTSADGVTTATAYRWDLKDWSDVYVRLKLVGTATQSTKVWGKFVRRS